MENYASPVFVIPILISFFSMLYIFAFAEIIFPIWMIVNCSRRSDQSSFFRFGWLLVIAITCVWGWMKGLNPWITLSGTTLYSIFFSNKKNIRNISILNIVVIVGVTVTASFMNIFNINTQTEKVIPALQSQIKGISLSILSQSNKEQMTNALNQLKLELKKEAHVLGKSNTNDIALIILANVDLRDESLTDAEAAEWLSCFRDRQSMDSKILRTKINAALKTNLPLEKLKENRK